MDPQFDLARSAAQYTDPSLEGLSYSHVSLSHLTRGRDDMRSLLPALRNFPEAIHPRSVVIDSDMPLHQAFRGLAPECPPEILVQQQLLRLFYFGTDGKLHHGQAVIHQKLASDLHDAFGVLLAERIPVGSVIPVAHPDFQRNGRWDDTASMERNNSSGFNYRAIITADGVQQRLSLHALGMAFDINPVQNPCYGAPEVHRIEGYGKEAASGYRSMVPKNASYDFSHPATLHERHPLVLALESKGWTWGGRWANPKDLHHFQKIPAELATRVAELREGKKSL